MKKTIFVITVFIALTQTSCVTSLQPLVTYNTVIADDRLAGTWKGKDGEYTVQKFFESDFLKKHKKEIEDDKEKKEPGQDENAKRDSLLFLKSYMISYYKGDVHYEMFGSLVQLGGQLFINFAPADINRVNPGGNENEISPTDRLNTYTIARIRFTNSNEINLDFINGGFIYDQVKAGHLKIKNERDDLYDTFLITASSEELQQFFEKYGKDSRFYDKENSTTLIRKS